MAVEAPIKTTQAQFYSLDKVRRIELLSIRNDYQVLLNEISSR